MTNPFAGFEDRTYYEEYLPAEEQIKPADPATLKGLMEVWRDTANQLNAEKLHTQKAHSDFVSAHEKYMQELNEKLKLSDKLTKEVELKDLAIQELNGFREQHKDHLEKLRRHRDELAEKVGQARAIRTNLNNFLEAYDEEEDTLSPINILRDIADRLERDLGDGDD